MKRTLCLFLALILAVGICFSAPVTITASAATAESDFEYEENDGGITIYGYRGSDSEIVIPDTIDGKPVTIIDDIAFQKKTELTSVTIPESVTSIGVMAFSGCTELTEIIIPDSVKSIGDRAFYGCTSLETVKIGNGVEPIGKESFSGCTALTRATIGTSVKTIGDSAFADCELLGEITIPDGVETIGTKAFYYCSSLETVTIPKSVTTIGSSAFYGIKSTATVSVPCKWNEQSFGTAFKGVTVTIAPHEYENGVCEACGYECPGHTYELAICTNCSYVCHHETVTDGVCEVCGGTYCGKTESDTVVYFYNESTKTLTISGEGAMADFTDTTMPWYSYRSEITTIVINKGVTSIGEYSFSYCSALTSVTIPESVTSIGFGAFYKCTSLPSVTIPSSVTTIGSSAFNGCTSLTTVTIPSSVTTIETYAFNGCTSLTTVTIPSSVTEIGSRAFSGCTSLTTVTLPSSVTTIDDYAFNGCTSLTIIKIPDSVTTIGTNAFKNCTALTTIEIPDSVTKIGANAFNNCTKLTTVSVPCSWNENPLYTFEDGVKVNIERHTLENNTCTVCKGSKCGATESDTVAWVYDEGTLYINGKGAMADFTYNTMPWYSYRSEITTIVINKGVTSIGEYSFYYCTALTSVTIPESVTTIGDNAFGSCSELALISIPDSVTEIGVSAFEGCTSLTTIEIPDSVTTIGGSAFRGCTSLASVTIGDSVTTIGKYAFYNCTALESIEIPDCVTTIGKAAFGYCTSLISVTIPENVTTIGASAFSDCTKLTTVNVPCNWDGSIYKFAENKLNIAEHKPIKTATCISKAECSVCGEYGELDADNHISDNYPYIDNGDGTHTKTHECGVAVGEPEDHSFDESEYCEFCEYQCPHPNYTNGRCDVCACYCPHTNTEPVYNSYEDNTNQHYKHYECCGVDEWAGYHNDENGDTKCDQCNVQLVAKAYLEPWTSQGVHDGDNYFADLEYAVDRVNAVWGEELILLSDVTIAEGKTITLESAILNTNGKKLTVNGTLVLPDSEYTGATIPTGVVGSGTVKIGENFFKLADNGKWCCAEESQHTSSVQTCVGYLCELCGNYYGEANDSHDIVIDEAKAPTCTETGLTEGQHCSRCENATVEQEVVPALNHKDTLVQVEAKAKTCTTIGWDAYEYCTACDYTTKVEIPASHEIVKVDAKAKTCTTVGWDAYEYCKDCNYTTYVEIPASHELQEVKAKAPTCEAIGWDTYKHCSECDYTTYVEKAKLGHDIVTDKAVAPTCTKTGLTEGSHCTRCNDKTVKQNVIPTKAHIEVTVTGKAATCTATGLTDGKKCSVCGTVTKAQETIKATGHTTSVINKKDATCTVDGYTGDTYCSVCKTTTVKGTVVKATGHKEVVIPEVAPTYTTVGKTEGKKCSVCGTITVAQKDVAKLTLAVPTVTIKNTAKGINVSWNKVDGAESYIVYRRTYNEKTKKWSSWSRLKTGVTATSYTDTTVKLGTKYRYTVKSVNGDVASKYISTSTLKYNVAPTVKVANASNGVKVSWSTVANATGYTVYSSTYNTKTKKWSGWKNRGTAKATATSWVDKNATMSGAYYKYTVRACNGNDIKSSYNKDGVKTLFLATPTVKIANNAKGVKVTWNKIASAKGYTVYRSEYVNGKWSSWKNLGTIKNANTVSWVDKSAKSGTTYRYTVRAVNGSYKSSYKASGSLIYLAQPTVKVANASNGIKVSWNKIDGVTGYTVYSSTYDAKTKKWSSWKNRGTAKADKTSWVDENVKSGVKYKYTVRAVNGKTKSTYVSSGALLYLAQPTVTVKATSNGINVSWTQCAGSNGYTVYRSELVNGEWSNWTNMGTAKSDKKSWTDKKAKKGVTYKYTVRAINGKVKSSYKASSSITK